MFEPENLNNASPATVSRAGIIYVSDIELGWEPVVKSWLQKRDATESAALQPLFAKYVGRMLEFVRLSLKPVMYNEQVSVVGNTMTLLHGYLKSFKETGTPLNEAKIERVFLYCLTWSLGGLLEVKDRPLFDSELRRWGLMASWCSSLHTQPYWCVVPLLVHATIRAPIDSAHV